MRPDALPVRVARSAAVLPPEAVEALFGPGYALRGTERIEVIGPRGGVFVEAKAGPALGLTLDALDREALGGGSLRLCGPRGAILASEPASIQPVLGLPTGLRAAWGLADESATNVAVGRVVLTGVRVETAEEPALVLDRAALLAGGADEAEPARWIGSSPDLATLPASGPRREESPEAAQPSNVIEVERRVVTENDVRRARMQRKTIRLRPGQLVTPAARSLGRELGVFAE